MNNTQSKLLLALGAIALAPAVGAQEVDEGDYEVGASSVSDDSAYFGNATGYDEEGAYGNLDGEGSYASGAYRMNWTVEDLGLDSRVAELEGSHAGKFDYNIGFRQLPYRQFNTTSTIFAESGNSLLLPQGWVRAPTTDGFTELDSSLVSRNIESDRSIYEIGGRYLAGSRWSFSLDYRRQENDGTKIQGGSVFSNSSLLPMPFEYVTDEVDFAVRYGADNSFVALSWYLSDFQNDNTALFWEQPFSGAAGADTLAQAQAPESRFQQLTLAGGYSFPELRTVMSLSAAAGNPGRGGRYDQHRRRHHVEDLPQGPHQFQLPLRQARQQDCTGHLEPGHRRYVLEPGHRRYVPDRRPGTQHPVQLRTVLSQPQRRLRPVRHPARIRRLRPQGHRPRLPGSCLAV
jgi:hypothetical protein